VRQLLRYVAGDLVGCEVECVVVAGDEDFGAMRCLLVR